MSYRPFPAYNRLSKATESLRVMAYRKNALKIPRVVTGAPGEVLSVERWPLREREAEALSVRPIVARTERTLKYIGATDCIVHFDQIRAGGKWNSRRVYYNGRFYVHCSRVEGGIVLLGGWVALEVAEIVTEWYGRDVTCGAEREALVNERYENIGVYK